MSVFCSKINDKWEGSNQGKRDTHREIWSRGTRSVVVLQATLQVYIFSLSPLNFCLICLPPQIQCYFWNIKDCSFPPALLSFSSIFFCSPKCVSSLISLGTIRGKHTHSSSKHKSRRCC